MYTTYSKFFATVVAIFFGLSAFGQVTTATITGLVKAANGEELPGATVVATHVPSGSRYGAVTNSDGRYTIPNMRVGGPYTVTFSMQSFEAQRFDEFFLSLGQKLVLDGALKENAKSLGEVVVTADLNDVVNNQRTGAVENIGRSQIATLPSISRSAADFTRLSPASDGNSFGGRNDQYNNFSLDGAIFNNPFGLDAATPGGQSDAQPISLDAIDQIQVSYAPYDVAQSGFTGAAINAVTKSGTNTVTGSIFTFGRNQSMIGKKVDGVAAPEGDLSQIQTGFSVGGPIIKNKLFFFVNAELERRTDLGSFYVPNRGTAGAGVSRVSASDLDAVSNALKTINIEGGKYDPGVYEGFSLKAPNQKGIFKLDWNINNDHKATFTYNFLRASKEKPANPNAIGRRGPDFTTLQFSNAGYTINNNLNSFLFDLKSTFGSSVSNKFQAGYTSFADSRDAASTPAPSINIAKDGVRYIIAGHEPFSIYNNLNQKVLQVNDNLNFYLGKHTLTVGGSFEKFKFENAFNLGAYPGVFGIINPGTDDARDFNSVQEFLDSTATGFVQKNFDDAVATNKANSEDPLKKWNWSYLNLGQVSAYIQDEVAITDRLLVTLGVRMDKPLYFNTAELIKEKITPLSQPDGCCYLPETEYFDEEGKAIKFDHTVLPSTKPLINPRFGFNYDVKGDKTMQVRGGSGLFSGRFPFVWVGNQVANPNFFFYCVTRPDFKWPQVWRTNLGYDQKLGAGFTASFDVIYTKDLNGMMVRNYGLKLPSARLNAPGDNRAIYSNDDRVKVFGGNTNAYVFTNTNVGQSTNVMLQLQRKWGSMSGSLGYNYLKATDASSIEAEISSDAYDRNPAFGNVNAAVAAPSLYGNKHRVVGSFAKKFAYGGMKSDKFATTIGVFFQYAKGGRYSYVYSGDLNNDGSGNNDLMYIPTAAQVDAMQFSGDDAAQTEQKAAFKKFIAQDHYMSHNEGKVVEKYGILSPWYNNWDMRLMQDFKLKGRNGFQLSLDILNAGNLVSNKWGVRKIPVTTQPLGVNVDKATGFPTYSFDKNITESFVQDFSLLSRWQMQLGLRFNF
jgi:Carboxypeptidase regulatory-like domain